MGNGRVRKRISLYILILFSASVGWAQEPSTKPAHMMLIPGIAVMDRGSDSNPVPSPTPIEEPGISPEDTEKSMHAVESLKKTEKKYRKMAKISKIWGMAHLPFEVGVIAIVGSGKMNKKADEAKKDRKKLEEELGLTSPPDPDEAEMQALDQQAQQAMMNVRGQLQAMGVDPANPESLDSFYDANANKASEVQSQVLAAEPIQEGSGTAPADPIAGQPMPIDEQPRLVVLPIELTRDVEELCVLNRGECVGHKASNLFGKISRRIAFLKREKKFEPLLPMPTIDKRVTRIPASSRRRIQKRKYFTRYKARTTGRKMPRVGSRIK